MAAIQKPSSITDAVWAGLDDKTKSLYAAQDQMATDSLNKSLANLQIQKRMQDQQEAISTASNLQKARHDMAKSVIDNMRV